MLDQLVVLRGGGDLGTGVAVRLWRSGFPVVVLESPSPTAVRRTVSFSEAIYDGFQVVEEVEASRVSSPAGARSALEKARVPVLVDPAADSLPQLQPYALVDAVMAKRNTGTTRRMAALVVGLGPGFSAGEDVDAVVETNRGSDLGRVLWKGEAARNTGEPAPVAGRGGERVVRAPTDGIFTPNGSIGDSVEMGDQIATVEGVPISAAFSGVIRGLLRAGLHVERGMKVGDLDPRSDPELCRRVSDKSLAIAGGVLEAIMTSIWRGKP